LRDYLIAGLLIWIPIMVTIWVLEFLTRILDQSIVLLPKAWRPEELIRSEHPRLGHRALAAAAAGDGDRRAEPVRTTHPAR
jgi:uncharacterized membrane protein